MRNSVSATSAGEAQVELVRATKLYDGVAAIRDVDLRVEKGEFFSILGPSGGGKTTVLRAIAGLLDLSSGDLRIAGQPVRSVPVHRRGVAVVFQNYALFPHMTVYGNIAFGLRMRHVDPAEADARVRQAMERVRLSGMADRKPSQLSGGQQQRVALARAIVVNPEVLLLDEPLAALDRNLRIEMQSELKILQRDLAVTTICVTHDQEEALSLSDRIAVMNRGSIEQIGTPMDIYEHPASRFVAGFVGGTNLLDGVVTASVDGVVTLQLAGGVQILAAGGASVGEKRALSLRHECFTLTDASVPALPMDNSITGTVTNIAYGGAESIFHVRIGESLTLVATLPGQPAHAVGASVTVSWPASRGLLLAD